MATKPKSAVSVSLDDNSINSITQRVFDSVVEEFAISIGHAVKDSVKDSVSDLEKKLHDTIRHEVEQNIKTLITSYEVKIMQIREDYLKSLENLVKSIPVPVVTVNQPNIDVTIPESAIQVKVEQELKQKPKKTRVEKSVVYGATGRPEKIVEETIESDTEEESDNG